MAHEIERKFLVTASGWREHATPARIRQGYLSTEPDRIVRVRTEGERATLTVKGPTHGITRIELEYAIPFDDARTMLDELCMRPLIEKTRHTLRVGPHVWQIDEFQAENLGLIVAEIELASAGDEFERPAWLGGEVSDDPRYFNANLTRHPYRRWRTSTS